MDDSHARSGGDTVDVVAHRRFGKHREYAGTTVHVPTMRALSDRAPEPLRVLWIKARL
jgi:hypothetical protein